MLVSCLAALYGVWSQDFDVGKVAMAGRGGLRCSPSVAALVGMRGWWGQAGNTTIKTNLHGARRGFGA